MPRRSNFLVVLSALFDRSSWLISLLIFQSFSSYILAAYIDLLESHPSIIYFLTVIIIFGLFFSLPTKLYLLQMLVGAGGNAGNQAAVRVIRGMCEHTRCLLVRELSEHRPAAGLAVGTMHSKTRTKVLCRELLMAVAICLLLSAVGLGRCMLSPSTSDQETFAISLALSGIVFCSVVMGCLLPLALHAIGFDPAHASTSIQVIMDILGVLFTCVIASFVLRVTVEAPIK